MFRKSRGRLTLREQLETNQRASNFYADMAGKPRVPNELLAALPPKRHRVKRPVAASGETEAPVISAVGDLLAAHPQVLLAIRQNSGAMPYQRDGRLVPVWFYKKIRTPEELTLVDYWGFLKDARPFAFECKRPSWKSVETPRERRQQAFLKMVAGLGGISAFVRSADDVAGLLP